MSKNTKFLKQKFSQAPPIQILIVLIGFMTINIGLAKAQTNGLSQNSLGISTKVVGDFIGPPASSQINQTDTTAVASLTPPQKTLLKVCQEKDYAEACAKILIGMMWKESRGLAKAIGDSGQARGYFQIHYKLHGITVKCAENLECSARWTLTYLEQNGYPKYVAYAVQCHNGCNADNGYAASAIRFGKLIWDKSIDYQIALNK